jgi:hypothetical protein
MSSDEPSSMLFTTWRRTPRKAYNPEYLLPIVQHGGGSVMIWAAISWYSDGPTLSGRITASDYMDILGNQVHPMAQLLFPNNDAVFQDDNSPIHTARSVQSWSWICASTSSPASIITGLNLLTTKSRLLYLKIQFVPRSKHFPSRLYYQSFSVI